jgi:hypothetical protein
MNKYKNSLFVTNKEFLYLFKVKFVLDDLRGSKQESLWAWKIASITRIEMNAFEHPLQSSGSDYLTNELTN